MFGYLLQMLCLFHMFWRLLNVLCYYNVLAFTPCIYVFVPYVLGLTLYDDGVLYTCPLFRSFPTLV